MELGITISYTISFTANAPSQKGAVTELAAARQEVDPFKDGKNEALTFAGWKPEL